MTLASRLTTRLATTTQDPIWIVGVEGIPDGWGTIGTSGANNILVGSTSEVFNNEDAPTGILYEDLQYTDSNARVRNLMTAVPTINGTKCEPLNGTTDPNGFSFSLWDDNGELSELFASNPGSMFELKAAVTDKTATSITLNAANYSVLVTAIEGKNIFLDEETLFCSEVHDEMPLRATVVRGCYGSKAALHALTDESGNPRTAYVSTRPQYWLGRRVTLGESRRSILFADGAAKHGDQWLKTIGYLDGLDYQGNVWKLTAKGILSKLNKPLIKNVPTARLSNSMWGASVDEDDDIEEADGTRLTMKGEAPWFRGYGDVLKWFGAESGNSPGVVKIGDELIRLSQIYGDNDYIGSNLFFVRFGSYTMTDFAFDANNKDIIYNLQGRGILSHELGLPPRKLEVELGDYRLVVGYDPVTLEPIYESGTLSAQTADVPEKTERHQEGDEIKLCLSTSGHFTAGTDPISVLLQVLCSTGYGDNGDYDTLPAWAGLGIDASEIDVDGIEALASLPGMQTELVFHLCEEIPSKDFLEKYILRPYLIFLVETPEGKISASRILSQIEANLLVQDEPVNPALILTDGDMLSFPTLSLSKPPVGKIEIKCNHYPPNNEFNYTLTCLPQVSLDRYKGIARNFELEFPGIYTQEKHGKSVSLGDLDDVVDPIKNYLRQILVRFSENVRQVISIKIPYNYLHKCVLGSLVQITSDFIQSTAGTMGVTNALFQIIECKPDTRGAIVALTLWQIGNTVSDVGLRQMAPCFRIESITGSSPASMVISKGVFQPDNGQSDAFDTTSAMKLIKVGDTMMALRANLGPANDTEATPEQVTVTAVDVATSTVTIDEFEYETVLADYILMPAYYDNVVARQYDSFSYLADNDGLLGTDADAAHRRI